MINKYKFIKTEDNSVGLYSNEISDIFHSKSGALTESIQKFVEPISSQLKNKNKIKVLDICYGIGYNSKALLLHSNNVDVSIDALEYDYSLVLLSPFIYDTINNYKLSKFLLEQICNDKNLKKDLYTQIFERYVKGNEEFFDDSISFFDLSNTKSPYRNFLMANNNSFLHNIYYDYISNRITDKDMKTSFNNSSINFYIGDARKTIIKLNSTYDIVFLDAFSPQKDPTLWTIDFLTQVKNKMNNNSILVSYSKSTPFRSALLELGFYVGKTLINNIDMGTVASFNENFILNKLSDYDLDLINTRSGITYKDLDLTSTAKKILIEREQESNSSSRISRTQFLKLKNQ